jgi:hypothetical protein
MHVDVSNSAEIGDDSIAGDPSVGRVENARARPADTHGNPGWIVPLPTPQRGMRPHNDLVSIAGLDLKTAWGGEGVTLGASV